MKGYLQELLLFHQPSFKSQVNGIIFLHNNRKTLGHQLEIFIIQFEHISSSPRPWHTSLFATFACSN